MEEGKKKVKVPRRPNRPLLVLWSLVLALLLVVSTALAVVLAPHADILNILLSKGDVTSEAAVQASQATADITEEVESEAVITDCTMAAGTSDVNRSVRVGNDINLNYLQDTAMTADTTDTAAGHQALRRATKNVLYMVVNSDALESTHNLDMPSTIRTGCIVFGVVAVALFGLYLWRRHVKMVRWREAGKPAGRIATWIAGRKAKA